MWGCSKEETDKEFIRLVRLGVKQTKIPIHIVLEASKVGTVTLRGQEVEPAVPG